jgi:hypothetical protein
MPFEELITRFSVRLSLLLYAATLAALLVGRSRPSIVREARLTWTAGCLLLWLHLAAAFHFYHQWSHQAAYDATARDTAAAIGWAFGEGVYFNYFFALVWTVDAAMWWLMVPQAYLGRARWPSTLVHGFLLFIVFNAAVVFVDGATRHISVVILAGLAMLALTTHLVRKDDASGEPING